MGLKSWQAGHRTWRRDQRDKRVRPTLTLLEERTLLSTLNLTVTTLADDPVTPISEQTTLRDAITQANASTDSQEVLNFAPGLQGTIDLTSALPALDNNITIQGPSASNLTVQRDSGAGTFSVFTVDSGQTVSLSGMTIAGGNATTIMGLGDSSGQGGGINNAGTLTVNDSTFTCNSANEGTSGGNSGGGGIYNSGTLMVNDSTFTDNSAPSGNGGGIWSDGTLMVNNSTFTSNSAFSGDGWGGGIENDGTLMVTNSTFTNNSAAYGGGGIFNDGTTVSVTNSTFTNNSAAYGGGIFNNVGVLTVTNTIVAGNTGNDIHGQVQPTSGYNLIGNGTGITNLNQLAQSNLIGTTADPINSLLGPLSNNGGPTQTMALLPGSPAINAGSNGLAVDSNGNTLTTDQRGIGFPRIVNGTVDIGAYESTYGSQSQTISFPPIPNQTYGVAPITLTATSSSNLPVTYIVISGPATISGSVLTITGAGLVDVEADQAGNATYAAATPVDESFTVNPAPLAVIVTTLADDPVTPISEQTTLRDAITQANASTATSQVITFAVDGTIDLTKPLPALNNNISLEGPGASDLTVQRVSSALISLSLPWIAVRQLVSPA
jgi:hypothetical protein